MSRPEERVEAYMRVRDLPYCTDAAHDAVGLGRLGRGDCVAKASLLADVLTGLGLRVRPVWFEYELPVLVDVQHGEFFRRDLHTALEVRTEQGWVLVDATHDPPLRRLGLTVGRWDGMGPTEPAFAPVGPLIRCGDPDAQVRRAEILARITAQVRATAQVDTGRYRRELNALFESSRSADRHDSKRLASGRERDRR